MARIPKCRCHLLRSHRRSRAWCCISCASTVIPLSQPGSPANTRRAARSSTWVKVASASNRWRTWLSTHEARRVEVERAKRRGCLTRSVKLALLVRYCFQRRSRDNRFVGRTVARVSAEEHMVNYRAARALLGKAKSERVRERGSSAKKGAKKSAVKKAKPKK